MLVMSQDSEAIHQECVSQIQDVLLKIKQAFSCCLGKSRAVYFFTVRIMILPSENQEREHKSDHNRNVNGAEIFLLAAVQF